MMLSKQERRRRKKKEPNGDIAEKNDVYMEHDSSESDKDDTDLNQIEKKTSQKWNIQL